MFHAYLNMIETLMESQSRKLYVGPDLDALGDSAALKKRGSRLSRLPVATDRAATMFFLNLQAWKPQPFIRSHYAAAAIDQLEHDLSALARTAHREREIEWGLRQIAFERL